MLKNYLTVVVRNIRKYKFFSFINIAGMTIGITAGMMVLLYILDELSYDRFHEKGDRMYLVGLRAKVADQDVNTASTCSPLAEALVSEVPEVEAATRLSQFGEAVVKYGEEAFTEDRVFYADSNFFDFFSFTLLEGDPKTALLEPNSVVLTQSLAVKYFGDEPALGKLVSIGSGNNTFKVTGVTPDCPLNSHFRYTMLLSASSSQHMQSTQWLSNWLQTYFLLREGSTLERISDKFKDMVIKYVGPEVQEFMGVSIESFLEQGGEYGFYATPLLDLHLRTELEDLPEPSGDIRYIYFFGAVGLFTIVIACINFMNLATARSAGRAKEVGLRKTLGSLRSQMIGQFLTESMMYSLAAVVLAFVLCYLLLPEFNLLAGKQLDMNVLFDAPFLGTVLVLVIFVGIVAGSYPAFYLTSFKPAEVLKGKIRAGMKSKGVRSLLVVFQFAISIFLIIFTTVVYRQLIFMQERNLGIDKHQVLILNNVRRLGSNMQPLKHAFEQKDGFETASYTNNVFPGINNSSVYRSAGSEEDHIMGMYYADYDHQRVLRFELKEGRYFSKDFPSDSSAVVLNEAAVKEFGFKDPLQEELISLGNQPERLKIIGVIKDFNFESMKTNVRPLAIRLTPQADWLLVRYNGDARQAVATAEKKWKEYAPGEPFDYSFLDENFDELFRAEQRMGYLFGVMAGLAIFIACLGLFALAAFTAEQRTKEIGIRKALGASATGLIVLLSKEFTKLVVIAFVPGALVAWFLASKWLNSFAYRIDIGPSIFILSGLAAICIAWLTVGFQSARVATSSPVNALRYE